MMSGAAEAAVQRIAAGLLEAAVARLLAELGGAGSDEAAPVGRNASSAIAAGLLTAVAVTPVDTCRQPARSRSGKAPGNVMDTAAWVQLRTAVRQRMQSEKLRYADLGALLSPAMSGATCENSICRSVPPTAPIVQRLQNWLAQPPAAKPPWRAANGSTPPAASGGSGTNSTMPPADTVAPQAAHAPLVAQELAGALRRKLHTAALTRGTVAERAGVALSELEKALAGHALPAEAAERLQAWAAG